LASAGPGAASLDDPAFSLARKSVAYGGVHQREALRKLVSETKSRSEAKGLIYGFHQMRRLGYTLEDASLAYRGRQGVDAVFSKGSRYAILEAKSGRGLSLLKIYAEGLRQGTRGYNFSRLQRYLQRGDGQHAALAQHLMQEAAAGRLESFASLRRSRRVFELLTDWPRMPPILR